MDHGACEGEGAGEARRSTAGVYGLRDMEREKGLDISRKSWGSS